MYGMKWIENIMSWWSRKKESKPRCSHCNSKNIKEGYYIRGWNKENLIHVAFKNSLREHFKKTGNPLRLADMDAICLEPYHECAHPVCLKNGEWVKKEN